MCIRDSSIAPCASTHPHTPSPPRPSALSELRPDIVSVSVKMSVWRRGTDHLVAELREGLVGHLALVDLFRRRIIVRKRVCRTNVSARQNHKRVCARQNHKRVCVPARNKNAFLPERRTL
eukprot:1449708-Rhodomonas_salina.1